MKTFNLLFSLAVLTTVPLLTSQAFIEQPDQQFKTFAEIQAEALASLDLEVDADTQRRNRLQALTQSQNSGVNRVKSAKLSFKKNSSFKKLGTVQRDNDTMASNPAIARKNLAKESARERIKAAIAARKSANNTSVTTQAETFNTEKKSSFDFVPEPGQIWGR